MKLIVLLDFDGVLFNSAYEAYQVCEHLAGKVNGYRRKVNFDEFMDFRRYVTNAWQFNRLYSNKLILRDFSSLPFIQQEQSDFNFADLFFESRKTLMQDYDWAKLMSPYPFFYELKRLIQISPETFKVLSTRDEVSVKRALDFFSTPEIEIYGQESLKFHDSKLALAINKKLVVDDAYTVYIDDMNYHLDPFQGQVDLCIHAGWGYDFSNYDSYSQTQAINVIDGLLALDKGKKND